MDMEEAEVAEATDWLRASASTLGGLFGERPPPLAYQPGQDVAVTVEEPVGVVARTQKAFSHAWSGAAELFSGLMGRLTRAPPEQPQLAPQQPPEQRLT
jgi:hypothetical protein